MSLQAVREETDVLVPQMAGLALAGADDLIREFKGEDGRGGIPPSLWEDPDSWVSDGVHVEAGTHSLVVHETPGHTRGHVVLHEERNALLFAGDHVLPHITPSIGFEAAPVAQPLRDFIGSLLRVRRLPDARLLPAHGPVIPSAHTRVDELLDHHDRRLNSTAALVEEGRDTAAAVAAGLTWTRKERVLDELDPFNRMLAILETKAHLDLLTLRGALVCQEVDGIAWYRQA